MVEARPKSRRDGLSCFCIRRAIAGLAFALLAAAAAQARPVGDCSSEPGLAARTDIAFCESWDQADWWRNGYLGAASTTRPVAATARDVANASVVTSGCVSGGCLKVEMKRYQSGALAIQWPLRGAGLAPEALHLRYYLKLGENFDPRLCSPDGKVVGSGGKFPGLADVRTYPEKQCGNGGEFGDGVNCWSMRTYFRDCNKGESTVTHACFARNATTRIGSYLYYYGQDGFQNAGIWDNERWGQGYFSLPFGSCSNPRDVGGCGIGTGGQLENGRWYLIEMYVKMNSPRLPDGVIRAWVDGKLSYEKTNMLWRLPGHDNLHVRTIWLNVHAGGEGVGLCSPSHILLDQLVAAVGDRVGTIANRSPGR